jgi:hypothetical protein
VLCNLICRGRKVGSVITKLVCATFLMDHSNKLRSQSVSAFSECLGAGIELSHLWAESVSRFGIRPTSPLWVDLHLWPCNSWSWLPFGSLLTLLGSIGTKKDFKLVATRVVLPMLLLILHGAFLFLRLVVGGTESSLVAFFLIPLYLLAIGGTQE